MFISSLLLLLLLSRAVRLRRDNSILYHTTMLLKKDKKPFPYLSPYVDGYFKIENLVITEAIPKYTYSKQFNYEEFASDDWLYQLKKIKLFKKNVFYIQVVRFKEPVVVLKITFICTRLKYRDYCYTAIRIRNEIYDSLDSKFASFDESYSHMNEELIFIVFVK